MVDPNMKKLHDKCEEIVRLEKLRQKVKEEATPDLPPPRFSGLLGRLPDGLQLKIEKALKLLGPRINHD